MERDRARVAPFGECVVDLASESAGATGRTIGATGAGRDGGSTRGVDGGGSNCGCDGGGVSGREGGGGRTFPPA